MLHILTKFGYNKKSGKAKKSLCVCMEEHAKSHILLSGWNNDQHAWGKKQSFVLNNTI